jgi:hypothetical protein
VLYTLRLGSSESESLSHARVSLRVLSADSGFQPSLRSDETDESGCFWHAGDGDRCLRRSDGEAVSAPAGEPTGEE